MDGEQHPLKGKKNRFMPQCSGGLLENVVAAPFHRSFLLRQRESRKAGDGRCVDLDCSSLHESITQKPPVLALDTAPAGAMAHTASDDKL